MKKYFFLILTAILAAGCHGTMRTGIYTDDIAMAAREGARDSLLMSVSLEFVKDGGEAGKAVNRAILSGALDFEDWNGTVEEAASAYRENLIDEFLTENSGLQTVSWEDRIDGSFSGAYKGWKNYVLTYYSYKGGPHGIQTVSPLVFDKDGAIVTEQDLFADGYTAPVADMLRQAVLSSMEKEDPELVELVDAELIGPNGNFSVGPDGVEWIFQPYEVGPYALGIVSASLSWKQLKPYLK
jgi:hypothetical protein